MIAFYTGLMESEVRPKDPDLARCTETKLNDLGTLPDKRKRELTTELHHRLCARSKRYRFIAFISISTCFFISFSRHRFFLETSLH